jgi:hypothetical protein
MMMTKMTPILALHGHFGGGGVLLLLMAIAACLLILAWPGKSETK